MENNIINVKTFKNNLFTTNAKKIKENGYQIDVLYNKSKFCLQSPLCTIEEIQRENDKVKFFTISFKISSNFMYYKFYNVFDLNAVKFVTSIIEKHKIMPLHKIESSFTSGHYESENANSVKLFLKLKITDETKFYNHEKSKMSIYELNQGDKIVCLMYTKGIFLDKKGINYRWTGLQILKLK